MPSSKYKYKFNRMNIVSPLPKIYCHGTRWGSFMCLTTSGPKDQRRPAKRTTGTAVFGFLSSNISKCLILNRIDYNKNDSN